MILGFTGTRKGMILPQRIVMREMLKLADPEQFHHGDCVGADAEAHDIISEETNADIIIHPPTNFTNRAFKQGWLILTPKEYKVRNCDIVDVSDTLFAAPKGMSEELRSGTWHAIRYATKLYKHVVIVYPNGHVETRYA